MCSVGVFRRHPPEDMDDVVPRLSSVAAEIETPGQSPRSGLASPHTGILQSGDSFTKAFMHQARRLRTAVLHQKVGTVPCLSPACAAFKQRRGRDYARVNLSCRGPCRSCA